MTRKTMMIAGEWADEESLIQVQSRVPETSKRTDPRLLYLLVLPYEGLTNQLLGVLRGALLAQRLGRTLLIPPLTRSQHEPINECPRTEPWSDHLDLLRVVKGGDNGDAARGGDPEYLDADRLGNKLDKVRVFSFGRWRSWRVFGPSTRQFLHWLPRSTFALCWRPFRRPLRADHLVDYLSTLPDVIVAIAQLQHVHFDADCPSLAVLYQRLHSALNVTTTVALTGVHWRRGDFVSACLNKNRTACWPDVVALLARLEASNSRETWIASDEPRAADQMRALSANITFLTSAQVCTERYFDDLRVLVGSNRMIANQYSTLSRLVCRLRAEAARGCEYF